MLVVQAGVYLTIIVDACHCENLIPLPFHMVCSNNRISHNWTRTLRNSNISSSDMGVIVLLSACKDIEESLEICTAGLINKHSQAMRRCLQGCDDGSTDGVFDASNQRLPIYVRLKPKAPHTISNHLQQSPTRLFFHINFMRHFALFATRMCIINYLTFTC